MSEPNPQPEVAAAAVVADQEYTLTDALKQEAAEVRTELGRAFKRPETLGLVEGAVLDLCRTLAARGELVTDDALETLSAAIHVLDETLSRQLNLILHHPKFQEIEGTWRGLEHLVYGPETGTDLKVRVLNITKDEMRNVFKRHKGAAWDQSPLFKKIYGPYDSPGGEPFGVLLGGYHFDHTPPDLEVVKGMAQIAAASHAPFVAGASPGLFNMDSWLELETPRSMADIFQGPEYAGWRGFRAAEDAKYVGLAMPRFLARLPYGKDNPVDGFDFQEEHEGGDHSKYTWANSAFAMGTNITQSFKFYGWCSCIWGKNSGGEVTGLNCHTFPTDDGGLEMKCPTEISIGDRRDRELAAPEVGVMDLRHWHNTDTAAFGNAVSLYQPKEFDDPDATANSKLNAQLPCVFALCRFAHYLKVMVREAIGKFRERSDMERWLDRWIKNYVTADPSPSEDTKAEYPLAAAEVEVKDVEGNPGYYRATFWLRPHYQLQGLTASLRLVTTLPSKKQGA